MRRCEDCEGKDTEELLSNMLEQGRLCGYDCVWAKVEAQQVQASYTFEVRHKIRNRILTTNLSCCLVWL